MKPSPIRVAIVVASLALSGCSSQPELEFAGWVLPVPEGTPVKEYAPVLLEARTEIAFEMVEDLVIGGDLSDPNTSFYGPAAVVAADNGNIFVVERGGARVQMFGSDGEFLKTLGKKGQGPGEFQAPGEATIAGDRLVVFDQRNTRLSIWTDEGTHVADYATQMTSLPRRLAGLPDGRMMVESAEMDLGALMRNPGAPTMTTVLATNSAEGEQLVRLLEFKNPPISASPETLNDSRARVQSFIDRRKSPRLTFAFGPERVVYVTPSSEYQVLAMTPAGDTSWALRVAWDRRPYPENSRETLVNALSRNDPELDAGDFEWPEFDNAISGSLRSDGQGRLYVSPLLERATSEDAPDEDEGPRRRPVDVYSPDGELIVAGLASGTWSYARGDYVYALSHDPETDVTRVIRYRLLVNPE